MSNFLNSAIVWAKRTRPYDLVRSIRRGGPKAHRVPTRWLRTPNIVNGAKVCVFVLLARSNRLMPHSVDHARAWHEAGFAVVAVVIVDSLTAMIDTDPLDFANAVMTRENRGYDFGAWAAAISQLRPSFRDLSLLVTANDSVLGPADTFAQMLGRVEAIDADLIGLTESIEITYHYQSYVLFFKPSALKSRVFRRFWNSVRSGDRDYVITHYELRLQAMFAEAGLRTTVLYPLKGVTSLNPTLDAWRDLLEIGFPFIKVQLLQNNQLSSRLDGWMAVAKKSGFDINRLKHQIIELQSINAARWSSDSFMAHEN